ncbi:metallophosphoesterase family protein [Vallitalea okinawensis]|uniref:metallophosphoesterase family protein n=1 Tax=Vallitalea okinawensis TaxID=2078660 RepID=UPI000CFE2D4F|nr:metallophosphoesterase family protein [Vallitalea okinawensis]
MNIACLFDIHANYPALKAVMNDLKEYSIDKIVIGGDFLSGPMPCKTLEELFMHKEKIVFIRGNGEDDILKSIKSMPLNHLSKTAREAINWVSLQIGSGFENFLETLPMTLDLDHDFLKRISFCHAVPDSTTTIFTRRTSIEKLRKLFENIESNYLICGHTHLQFKVEIDGLKIYNAGSVGMSFSNHLGADWILIGNNKVMFKTTEYDYDKCEEMLLQTTYPQIKEFIKDNVFKFYCEEDVLNYLENLQL